MKNKSKEDVARFTELSKEELEYGLDKYYSKAEDSCLIPSTVAYLTTCLVYELALLLKKLGK